LEPARLSRKPGGSVDATAGAAPGLGHSPSPQRPDPELAMRVSHPLAAGAPTPARQLSRFTRLPAVLDDQRQRLGKADLPARIHVHRGAGTGPGADEIDAAKQRVLFQERSRTGCTFHGEAHYILGLTVRSVGASGGPGSAAGGDELLEWDREY